MSDKINVLPETARVVSIIVGLENYRPTTTNQIRTVEFASADAEAFKATIEEVFAAYRPEFCVLKDGDATLATLVDEIKNRIRGLSEDNLFIFYYAGHGFHDGTSNRLTAWDTSLVNVEGTTLRLDTDLLSVLRKSPCQRLLAFIDACASNCTPLGRTVVTSLDPAEFTAFLRTALYSAAFLSCRPGEQSYPDSDLGHGVWTHFLLRALNGAAPNAIDQHGYITNATLQDYLRQEVSRHVAQNPRINATQTPEAVISATNTFAIRYVPELPLVSKADAPAQMLPASQPSPSFERSPDPYPGSDTSFFHDRFASAFPGVRQPRWFTEPADVQRRLTRLLAPPLTFANGTPFWWWGDGNFYIDRFDHVADRLYIMGIHELEIARIAAVPGRSYWGDFVYVEVAAMTPTGANTHTTPEEIALDASGRGYSSEEYGLVDGRFAISRPEYDDGAAEINGELVDTGGRTQLRVRYLTPYNFLIAANGSPINSDALDQQLPQLLHAILDSDDAFELLVKAAKRLPRQNRERSQFD